MSQESPGFSRVGRIQCSWLLPEWSGAPAPGHRQRISLGSTLRQLHVAYDKLRFVGVDKWQAANGLIFVVNAAREPEPRSSKVIEIKFGTCGDF